MRKPERERSFVSQNINGRGFHVTGEKFAPIRRALLASLPRGPRGITFAELVKRIAVRVKRKKNLFPHIGSVMWYAKVVQLDLEKSGAIERIPGAAPLRLRLRRKK
jgi:hypothetical protein